MEASVVVGRYGVAPQDVIDVARRGARVVLGDDAREALKRGADVVAGLRDRAHQRARMPAESPAGVRQHRAAPVTDEQGRAERTFERDDAGADRRLGDVQLLGRGGEAAGLDDLQEGVGERDVHRCFNIDIIDMILQ